MKNIITVLSALAFVGMMSGCSDHQRTSTTTRETIQTAPMDPIVTEKQTTTHTETH
jgi:hypothetical protein